MKSTEAINNQTTGLRANVRRLLNQNFQKGKGKSRIQYNFSNFYFFLIEFNIYKLNIIALKRL